MRPTAGSRVPARIGGSSTASGRCWRATKGGRQNEESSSRRTLRSGDRMRCRRGRGDRRDPGTGCIGTACAAGQAGSRGARVSRHDRLGRCSVHAQLQPVFGLGAERRLHEGRHVRAAHRRDRRRWREGLPLAGAELEVEQRQQDADAADPAQRQVVGRQAADRRRCRLQPHGRQAGQGHGHHRPLPRRDEHRLDQAAGDECGRDHAEDARLAVHRRQPEPAVRRAEAHLVEAGQAADVQELQAGGLGPVHDHHAPDDAGHRLRQEPELLEAGRAEGPVPRVHRDDLE